MMMSQLRTHRRLKEAMEPMATMDLTSVRQRPRSSRKCGKSRCLGEAELKLVNVRHAPIWPKPRQDNWPSSVYN
jgi:hypothetical protein